MKLTKETEKVFKIIFCTYLSRRKSGLSKLESLKFSKDDVAKIPAFSDWNSSDIDFSINELKSYKLIKKDVLGAITITDEGIRYMENKPKEFFSDLIGFFDGISPFLKL